MWSEVLFRPQAFDGCVCVCMTYARTGTWIHGRRDEGMSIDVLMYVWMRVSVCI